MGKLASLLFGASVVLLAAGAAGAGQAASAAGASARAYAIKVVVPGQDGAVTGSVAAPPDSVSFGGGFAYPEDGSVVSSGATTASASSTADESAATASASSGVEALSLFGGEITVARVVARAKADAADGEGSGDLSGAELEGLTVLGQAVDASTPGARISVGDWGYAIVLAQGPAPGDHGYRGFVTALEVHLNVDHGGLPAGSAVFVAYAEAAASAPPPPKQPAGPPVTTPPKHSSEAPPDGGLRARGSDDTVAGILRRPIPSLTPRLTKGGYVFPVHGPASFTDTFGAARAVVDWHHGEDIFAPIGAPVLAVADGTVFSVGWNDLGGNRFWLRDREGNEFYYAHLSAFTVLAVNGAHVRAGDVIGFVGNSGDAEGTPPHLHFEIHHVSLLGLGYDGVIPPYRYLLAWRRLEDVRFLPGSGFVLPAATSRAPNPGAFLLSSTDISTASGLRRGSLRRALREPVSAEASVSEEVPAGGPPASAGLAGAP